MSFAIETPVVASPEDERKLIVEVLSKLGASQAECAIQADVLTEGDLRGHHSHGLQRLPVLATRIKKGLIRVNSNAEFVWTADSVLSVDGKDGLGTFVADSALNVAKSALGQRGIVAVAIRNSSHLGMIGYYCEKKARDGLICIAMTVSEPLVHPHGGTEALVVGLNHTGFVKFREKAGRDLTDREASFIAAEYLKERLEEEDERKLYDVTGEDVTRLISQVGIK